MQIDADIYCDTQLIIAELERRHPTPTVFPDGNPGLGWALGSWAHGPYVVTSVAIYMGIEDPYAGAVNLPRHFFEDRKTMWKTQFGTDSLKPKLPGYRTRLRAHTDFIDMQLADGRPFLTGDKPGLADLHAMWDPWFLRRFAPAGVDPDAPLDIPQGTPVIVTPSDYAEVPVAGELVATTVQSVSIRREDPAVGEMVVHFPKIGYEITRA